MSYTKLAGVCDEGDCPTIHRDDTTGDILIQGYVGAGPTVPHGEGTVRMTRAQLDDLIAQLAR